MYRALQDRRTRVYELTRALRVSVTTEIEGGQVVGVEIVTAGQDGRLMAVLLADSEAYEVFDFLSGIYGAKRIMAASYHAMEQSQERFNAGYEEEA